MGIVAACRCAISMATRAALTLYSVPHLTLGAELTPDYDERTILASVRSFLSIGGAVSVVLVGFAFFFKDGGQLDAANYPPFALTAAVAMVVTIVASAAGTHSYIPSLPKAPEEHVRFSAMRLWEEVRRALGLQPFRLVLAAMVANAAVMGLLATLATYILTFFWELEGLTLGVQARLDGDNPAALDANIDRGLFGAIYDAGVAEDGVHVVPRR